MTDYLLRGLREIHEELYTGKDGELVLSFNTFRQKEIISKGVKIRMVEDMQRVGILFEMVSGEPWERKCRLCGWRNEIMNYMRLLHQEQYEMKNPSPV